MRFFSLIPGAFLIVGVVCSCLLLISPGPAAADEITSMLDRVASLNITRQDYRLGRALTKRQQEIAREHPVTGSYPKTYKFRDQNLVVVAEEGTDRVILLYEQYQKADRSLLKNMLGTLFYEYGDPTVTAHDKLLYWVYGEGVGKMSEEYFQQVKDTDQGPEILATVKMSSSVMFADEESEEEAGIYYIVSSEPLLALITGK